MTGWSVAVALYCCETDRMAEARTAFTAMRQRGLKLPVDWAWPSTMSSLAEVCAYLQDTEAAAVLYP
jgi:hypothetical protein